MYKSRLHRFLWFPYQPGRTWLMILLIVLVFLVAAAGVSAKFSIFVQLDLNNIPFPFWVLIAAILVLSMALTLHAARTDYLSAGRSFLPCIVSTFIVWLACLIVANIAFASSASPVANGVATNQT